MAVYLSILRQLVCSDHLGNIFLFELYLFRLVVHHLRGVKTDNFDLFLVVMFRGSGRRDYLIFLAQIVKVWLDGSDAVEFFEGIIAILDLTDMMNNCHLRVGLFCIEVVPDDHLPPPPLYHYYLLYLILHLYLFSSRKEDIILFKIYLLLS
jgi:hypothetical protein